MKKLILLFLLIFSLKIAAQDIKIGIFNTQSIKKVLLEVDKGKYKVRANGKKIYTLKGNRTLILSVGKSGITASTDKQDYNAVKELSITGNKRSAISVKLIAPKQKVRKYAGNLHVLAKKESIKLVNLPPFNAYLAGVVESESGTKAKKEYYKNQAIICRTYALQKWDKHKKDGFNLCDGVHCQAYKGLSTENELIRKSVRKTKNLVILDQNNRLIDAVFSANCGGQTNNSEMVWNTKIPYLRSVKDPYCIDQRQAHWDKTVSVQKFENLLINKGIKLPANISAQSFEFKQPKRLKYYTINNQQIKLTTIRYGLKLRSTFFEIEADGDNLLFHGKGYGHGVGMCQEGAMNMAKKGKKFDDIIKFYYTGIKIKPMSKAMDLPDFQQ